MTEEEEKRETDDFIQLADGLGATIVNFITAQHIVTGEWPNGFALCERHSRGMALLGAIAGLKIAAAALGLTHDITFQSTVGLYDSLKDYLCGLEVMILKFPIMYRVPSQDGEEDGDVDVLS